MTKIENFTQTLLETIGEKEAENFAEIATKAMQKNPVLFKLAILQAKKKLKKIA